MTDYVCVNCGRPNSEHMFTRRGALCANHRTRFQMDRNEARAEFERLERERSMSNPSNAGPQTGRMASSQPNLSNVPEQIAQGTIVLGDDFNSHRIRGTVYHAPPGVDPDIDAPLITHVEGNLWQGGCMGGVRLPDGFDYVLSLYPWEQYVLPEGCIRDEVKMYDALDQGFEQVEELAQQVKERLNSGETVLIHCQAGLNRSGLLTARVLMLLGKTPAEAIALLREQRSPLVLCNSTFEEWLLGHE